MKEEVKEEVPITKVPENFKIEDAPPVSKKNDRIDKKLRWDLLPILDIEEIVKVYTAGAEKYGPNLWQNLDDGYQRYKAALMRHLVEYEKGNRIDTDTGCMHLAQVAWNAIAMLHMDLNGKGLFKINTDEDARNKE